MNFVICEQVPLEAELFLMVMSNSHLLLKDDVYIPGLITAVAAIVDDMMWKGSEKFDTCSSICWTQLVLL